METSAKLLKLLTHFLEVTSQTNLLQQKSAHSQAVLLRGLVHEPFHKAISTEACILAQRLTQICSYMLQNFLSLACFPFHSRIRCHLNPYQHLQGKQRLHRFQMRLLSREQVLLKMHIPRHRFAFHEQAKRSGTRSRGIMRNKVQIPGYHALSHT